MRYLLFALLAMGCGDKGEQDDEDVVTDTTTTDPGTDTQPIDADGDGFDATDDCDDANVEINPDAEEVCDEVDNNCDGQIDEGVMLTWYYDFDGDGYGNDAAIDEACEAPTDYVSQGGDCDVTNDSVYPGALEDCDQTDSDCDGSLVDEFANSDDDIVPDCEDTDDDNDGVSDWQDCAPLDLKMSEADCAGICEGTSWQSDCGCVSEDNTGDDCDDCAGVANGSATVDNCGTCDDDVSNECIQDCAGTWGGSLELDECDVCGGDNSTCTDECGEQTDTCHEFATCIDEEVGYDCVCGDGHQETTDGCYFVEVLTQFDSVASSPRPDEVIFDGTNLWVREINDYTVYVVSPETGEKLGEFDSGAISHDDAWDGGELLWTTSYWASPPHLIQIDLNGNIVLDFTMPIEMNYPTALALDETNEVLWTINTNSSFTKQVWQIDATNGDVLDSWEPADGTALNTAYGMCMADSSDHVWIVSGNRLKKFSLVTRSTEKEFIVPTPAVLLTGVDQIGPSTFWLTTTDTDENHIFKVEVTEYSTTIQ